MEAFLSIMRERCKIPLSMANETGIFFFAPLDRRRKRNTSIPKSREMPGSDSRYCDENTKQLYTHTRTHTHTHTHTQHRPLWRMRKGHNLYTIPLQSRRSQTQTRVLFLYSFPEKVWLRYSASLFTSSIRCSTSTGNGSYRLFFSGDPCEVFFYSTHRRGQLSRFCA